MGNKMNKTLTGAMAAMMATGVVAPVMAETTTDVDALYLAAYNATQKATTDKTQASINEARVAIEALRGTAAEFAIGEFSKNVDVPQHAILVTIVDAITAAQTEKTQASINAAFKTIPAGLPDVWANSYSVAIDQVQQEIQKVANDAADKAISSKKTEDIEAAKKLLADIATADNKDMADWANARLAELDAIFTLKVTNFSVTANGVTVEFDPTTEILRDVTVTVFDNNGKEVPVQKVDRILAGKSKQVFSFEKVVGGDIKGVWTVNGVAIDMTEVDLVKELTAAKTEGETGKALVNLQEKGYINGLLGKYESVVGSTEKIFAFDEVDANKTKASKYYHVSH